MTTELWMLAWSAALCALLWIPYLVSRMLTWGIADTVGYPQDPPARPAWAQRAHLAHGNLVENLAPFAAVVLIAHVAGANNEMTAFGAVLFDCVQRGLRIELAEHQHRCAPAEDPHAAERAGVIEGPDHEVRAVIAEG